MKDDSFKLNLSITSVAGPDAKDFLHRMTTQNINGLELGSCAGGALLQANGTIISYFIIYHIKEKEYWLIGEKTFSKATYEALEKFHFAEDLEIKDISDQSNEKSLEIWKQHTKASFNFQFGVDITEKNMILEAPLNDFVARNKGCYPGQEVVERVFTYGNLGKKLVGLKGADTRKIKAGAAVFVSDENVGVITSVENEMAFAILRRPHYEEGQMVKVENIQLIVFKLPGTFEIARELKK